MQQRNDQSGFTLLELIMTLAVGAVLLAVAVPSFRGLLGSNAMSATANTLVYSLQMARSEAVKRAVPVGLCASNDSLVDAAVCSAGTGFAEGWIVYVDDDADGTRDSDEDLILQIEPLDSNFILTPDATLGSQVYFNDSGNSVNSTGIPLSGNIDISYNGGEEKRRVTVSANGRIGTSRP